MSGAGGSRPHHQVAVSATVAVAAFDQLGVLAFAVDGPQLRVVAVNRLCRQTLSDEVGPLGTSLRGSAWLLGTGLQDKILQVLQTGEPFAEARWPALVPARPGGPAAGAHGIRSTPWLRADDTTRGVIVAAWPAAAGLGPSAEGAGPGADSTNGTPLGHPAAALRPDAIPVLPGLQLGARCVLPTVAGGSGGDWFSSMPLGLGRVALVVGDVVGAGVLATAVMARLRAVLEERLRAGSSIAAALGSLDAVVADTRSAEATTVCVVVIDTVTGELEYCTAGHPPPLVVEGQRWRFLAPTGSTPLGGGSPFSTARDRLPEDGLLVLYTNGLVGGAPQFQASSPAEFAEVVAVAFDRPARADAPTHAPDRVCERAVAHRTRHRVDDDATVLAVHRVGLPHDLHLTLTADTRHIARAAVGVDRWLAAVDAGAADRVDLSHAVIELVTNSIEHAAPDPNRTLEVRVAARLDSSGTVVVEVSDNGRWREAATIDPAAVGSAPAQALDFRGLGLALAGRLTNSLVVRHHPGGSSVTVTRRLSRPVGRLAAPFSADEGRSGPERELVAYLAPDRPATLVVLGPVILTTADRFRDHLAIESRSGTLGLTVDLDGVTHLGSVGVQILQQARRASAVNGQALRLLASSGTAADHVLRQVGLAPTGSG